MTEEESKQLANKVVPLLEEVEKLMEDAGSKEFKAELSNSSIQIRLKKEK